MSDLARRWTDRALYPGSGNRQPGPDAAVEVSGEYVREIALPPATVWAALATPGTHADLGTGFVIDGPGPERWCLMSELAGGLVGGVVEVPERDEGRRLVLRIVKPETVQLRDWAVFDPGTQGASSALVRLRVTLTVRGAAAEPAERAMRTTAERLVARLDHRLTGAPPPEPLPGAWADRRRGCPEHRSSSPITQRTVEAQVVVPLPVDAVWRGVLDASAYHLDGEPGRSAAVVPGTPVGQVGEMRYEVCVSDGYRYVRFHEVVEVGPGRRLVLRHHSSSHPSDSVVTVASHADGSLVRVVREVLLHEDQAWMLEPTRSAHLGSLTWLCEELVRRSAPPAEGDDEPLA